MQVYYLRKHIRNKVAVRKGMKIYVAVQDRAYEKWV